VLAALSRGGISWGRTVTTDATAASARARRSRRGVAIPAGPRRGLTEEPEELNNGFLFIRVM
jgi:hypothetical protein